MLADLSAVTPVILFPFGSNFFYGFLLAASDRIYEGDSIRLSKSGFKGQVYRLGWLETVLRGSDDIMVTVPNSELLGNQISNLSRIRICQVYQTLRFVSASLGSCAVFRISNTGLMLIFLAIRSSPAL